MSKTNLPVTEIKSVGIKLAQNLKKLDIASVGDLLYHFPHKYLDLSKVKKISQCKAGELATVTGIISDIKKWRGKKGTLVLNVFLSDGTGSIAGTWFNQPFMEKAFKVGMQVAFSGRIDYKMRQLQIVNPFFDILSEDKNETIHSGRIIPIHPATKNVSTTLLRRIINNALNQFCDLEDPIPKNIREELKLLPKSIAIKEIHFPSNREMLKQARTRLIFEELFVMQIGLAARKKRIQITRKGIEHKINGELLAKFYKTLPFELTKDQKKVIAEIQQDMAKSKPMNRLLQGEVGSGKTMVALAALLTSVQGGYQAAMMAPTEVLASQHYIKLKQYLETLNVTSALLTGSIGPKEKEIILAKIKSGEIDIVIGTHAIIQESVDFYNLGLVVVDEQHRFGVQQRMTLKEKGYYPDFLIMSATPIPRTLSLTLYGDLDVSIIRELPGNKNIGEHVQTVFCKDEERDWAYNLVRSEVSSGRQAFIICPLIEESDKLEVKAVMEEAEHLKNDIFPDLRVGLIHGKLKSAEKDAVMTDFAKGNYDILISTTVIEVGIDVPNATVIIIENADRFGLAQLHQLRGRVGRGNHKAYCILFASLNTEEARQRMEAICGIKDGFLLAEADLKIRGEGQIFGTRQSGLPDLKLAKLIRDIDILAVARKKAFELVDKDPYLKNKEHSILLKEVLLKFGDNLDWLFQA